MRDEDTFVAAVINDAAHGSEVTACMSTFTRARPLLLALGMVGCTSEPAVVAATPPASRSPAPATEHAAYAMVEVMLYQHENIAAERLGGADELGEFLKAVERTVAASIPAGSTPRELDVVIAIKPGRKARFWFVQVPDGDAIPAQVERDLQALDAPEVVGGPVAVALIGSVFGAPTSARPGSPPMPRAWRDAAAEIVGSAVFPDSVIATLWPD